MITSCPHCGTLNRVPAKYLAATGKCGRCRQALSPTDRPMEVSGAEFDHLINSVNVPVLVDFWAPWCGPCKTAVPELAKAAKELAGEALVFKVNTEIETGLASRYRIRSLPYFAVIENCAIVRDQAGLIPAAQMVQLVRE